MVPIPEVTQREGKLITPASSAAIPRGSMAVVVKKKVMMMRKMMD